MRHGGHVEPGQRERVGRVVPAGVVDEQRIGIGVRHVHGLQPAVPAGPQPLTPVRAEPDRLTVGQPDQLIVPRGGVLQRRERVVIEDRAVLVDLHKRGAAVIGGGPQHAGQVLAVGVDGAGHEAGLCAQRERDRVERGVQRPERCRLGHLALLRRGRVLALGQPVDAVVEQQDLDVHVAPQRVDEVIAADRQRVAIPGDHPDRQVRAGGGQPGRDGRRAPVDRVHPVAVHVVRQPGRAADARDHHQVLPGDLQLGQERLERGQDRVVATPGTPAHFLVGLEVLGAELLVGHRYQGQRGGPSASLQGPVVGRAVGPAVRGIRHCRSHPGSRRPVRRRGWAARAPGCRRSHRSGSARGARARADPG